MNHARFLLVLVLLLAVSAHAQTITGSMTGTVVDPSGQVIPGADVTLLNEKTGEERKGTTSEVGDFAFAALVPGAYTIRVEMPGFKPLEVKGNNVISNSRLAVGSLRLVVGEVTESVTVSAQGSAVATTTTAHQGVLDVKQVANLSIRGRDPISLLKVLPGVALLANDQETFGGSFSTPVPNIQGGRGQTLYVDGVNGGDAGNGGGGGGNFSGATNIDAISEVNVQMSAYTAEYGLKGGAQVNFITKRGGSDYHGTGYWYKRHEMFNATNFFNNIVGRAKPVYRYSTLGGNIGGPIPKIPKINPDGNRLFFFYSIDDTQLKDANILRRYTMPTALERAGNFSQTRTTAGALITVRDPQNNLQAFPNNIIPADRAHPLGVAMLNILPLPNATGVGFNYLTQEPSIPHPRRQHLMRFDYRPTERDSFGVKYQTWYTKSVGWEVAGRSAPWGLVRQRYDFTADQAKIEYTRIISPQVVLELSAGVFYSTENGPPEDDTALAGIQRQNRGLGSLPQFAKQHNPLNLIPKVQFGTVQSNSQEVANVTYDNRWPITGADTAFPLAANMTWNRGSHTFKFGGLREHERFGQARSGIFAGEFSFANDGADPANTGFAYANAFIGHVTSYSEDLGRVPDNFYQSTWAFYGQDTWKVNRRLTVDAGLRVYRWGYPLWGGGEASAFSFERFDPAWGGNPPVLYRPITTPQGRRAVNPQTGQILPVTFVGLIVPGTGYSCTQVITPQSPCKINGIVNQNDSSYSDSGKGFWDRLGLQWDPRIGVAYDPFGDGKTVIRTSVGAFHQGTGGFAVQGGGPAFRFNKTVRFTELDSYATAAGATNVISVSGSRRKDQKLPVTYNYTFGVQRDIGFHMILDVAYVGNNTHHIQSDWDYNAVPAGARFRPENRDTTVTASAANPGALPDNFLRPIPGFGSINIGGPATSSRYDSLQVQLNRRFTRGFELTGAYTWAGGTSTGRNQNNPLPSSEAKSRSNIQAHVLAATYMIDIPGGSRLVRWAPSKWVLDNWRISGISTFATGSPSDVSVAYTDNFDFSGGGETCGNIIQNGSAVLTRGDRSVDRWFRTEAFARPSGRGQIGNNCNNAKLILPGFNNHDFSLFKDFPVKENHSFQFRWEMYNAFNHTQFNAVDTSAQFNAAGVQTDANFGKVTSARNERRMQFSLRYSF